MTKPNHKISIAALLAALLASMLIAGCGKADKPAAAEAAEPKAAAEAASKPSHEEAAIKLSDEEAQRAGIEVQAIKPQPVADQITVTATVHANQERLARIAPRVEGRIVDVQAKLGDKVKAGQTLAVLDSVALGEAQAALQLARTGQQVAQADFKRAESLNAEEIIPRREYLRAKAELDKAIAELRAAQDRLRLLGGTAQTSGRAVSTFVLAAPLAGTVIERNATVGELGSPSEALFTVADLSTVWVEADLTEALLGKVRIGAPATVTLGAYPGERFEGRVTYVASVLDKDSRTAAARIELPNPDGRLKPQMFATASIQTGGAKADALSVPDNAILLLQGQPTVFVAEPGGYEPRAVETGDRFAGRTVLKSGVVAGEPVVVAGAYALKARLLKSQIGDEH